MIVAYGVRLETDFWLMLLCCFLILLNTVLVSYSESEDELKAESCKKRLGRKIYYYNLVIIQLFMSTVYIQVDMIQLWCICAA